LPAQVSFCVRRKDRRVGKDHEGEKKKNRLQLRWVRGINLTIGQGEENRGDVMGRGTANSGALRNLLLQVPVTWGGGE